LGKKNPPVCEAPGGVWDKPGLLFVEYYLLTFVKAKNNLSQWLMKSKTILSKYFYPSIIKKTMKETTANWNEHEFKVYLLLYAANADFHLSEEEREIILSKASQDEFKHVSKAFEKDNDFERLETILSFREKFYPTDSDIERLKKDLCELLSCDDGMNLYERNFFILLKKLLNSKKK
jgi:hypothetical protein